VLNIATGGSGPSTRSRDDRFDPRGPVEDVRAGAARDVRESWADVSAAREAIGYEPRVGFEEGLRRTIDAMLGTKGAR
jgi:nucleoside-diphosphate-sugar epimerase